MVMVVFRNTQTAYYLSIKCNYLAVVNGDDRDYFGRCLNVMLNDQFRFLKGLANDVK